MPSIGIRAQLHYPNYLKMERQRRFREMVKRAECEDSGTFSSNQYSKEHSCCGKRQKYYQEGIRFGSDGDLYGKKMSSFRAEESIVL